MPEGLDPKVAEEVYADILTSYKKAASAQGRGVGDAEEVAAETVTRLMEISQKKTIDNPLYWARKTASHLWKDLWRGEIRLISYDDMEPLTEHRSPEILAEQRDFIQKIDPDWKDHMEEGYDFSGKKKLDRNVRRQIKRRAKALLRNEPPPQEFDTTIGARVK